MGLRCRRGRLDDLEEDDGPSAPGAVMYAWIGTKSVLIRSLMVSLRPSAVRVPLTRKKGRDLQQTILERIDSGLSFTETLTRQVDPSLVSTSQGGEAQIDRRPVR